jgi:hypothetical protein
MGISIGRFVDPLQYGRRCVRLRCNPRLADEDPPRNFAEEALRRVSPTAYALRFDPLVGELTVDTLKHGPPAHMAVCEVLDFVKQHYAPNLEVHDDSGYFRHRDRERLEAAMAETNALLGEVVLAVGCLVAESGSATRAPTLDAVIRRVEAYTGLRQR